MNATVEKHVQLSGQRAQRLEKLAAIQGITENALIEKALDLLFEEELPEARLPVEDAEFLRQLEAEAGPLLAIGPKIMIAPSEIVSIAGTPIASEKIRRFGDPS